MDYTRFGRLSNFRIISRLQIFINHFSIALTIVTILTICSLQKTSGKYLNKYLFNKTQKYSNRSLYFIAVCPLGEFECKLTQKCIPNTVVCDHDTDCGDDDLSDEENCGNVVNKFTSTNAIYNMHQ